MIIEWILVHFLYDPGTFLLSEDACRNASQIVMLVIMANVVTSSLAEERKHFEYNDVMAAF